MTRTLRVSLVALLGPVIALLLAFLPFTDQALLGDSHDPVLLLLTLSIGVVGLATALSWTVGIHGTDALPRPDAVKALTVPREVAVLWSAFVGSLTYLIAANRATGALPGAWFSWSTVAVGLATATRLIGTGRSDLQAALGDRPPQSLHAAMRGLRRWERWYLACCAALGFFLTSTILLFRIAGSEVAGRAVSTFLLGALGVAYALIVLSVARNIAGALARWWRRRATTGPEPGYPPATSSSRPDEI